MIVNTLGRKAGQRVMCPMSRVHDSEKWAPSSRNRQTVSDPQGGRKASAPPSVWEGRRAGWGGAPLKALG
jgi:hypothetical protein